MSDAVCIKNFSYDYPDGTKALDDISLNIAPGQKVALIGANGSGKSTLLLAMVAFIRGKGSVFVKGTEVTAKNAARVRKNIGLVMQNPDEQLFMQTIWEDVAFGPLNMGLSDEDVHTRTHAAIDTVGLTGMETKAPHHLSAGQKRSAAIATILSMNPAIITMDEPDTSLDPRSRNHLVDLLHSLSQTLIIATCNMHFAAQVCDRCILISNGKVVADADTRTILTDQTLMQQNGLETVIIQ